MDAATRKQANRRNECADFEGQQRRIAGHVDAAISKFILRRIAMREEAVLQQTRQLSCRNLAEW
jgi:hypothetical protein